MKPSSTDFLEWARAYSGIGWIVLPLGRRAKIPVVTGWQELEDNEQIDKWWREDPERNIGVVAGETSGILVVDVDFKVGEDEDGNEVVLVDGEKTLSELEAEHGPLPKTVEQITGSGEGRHLVFKFRPGLRNKGRRRGGDDDGLDVRTSRGQIVVEPSIHPVTGQRYRWKEGHTPWDLAPAEMPDWLYDILPKNQEEKYESSQTVIDFSGENTRLETYIDNAITAELDAVREQGEGGRNDRLNEAAYKIATLYHFGTFGEDDAKTCLYDAGRECGLKHSEVNATIRSGWNSGLKRPRSRNDLPSEIWEEPDYIEIDESQLNPNINLAFPLLMSQDADEPSEQEVEIDVEQEHTFYQDEYKVPPGTFDIPGKLGELCKWIDMCARRPAPLLTLGCALSMLSVLFGKKYSSHTDVRTNLYVVGVAPTAAGKDNARKRVAKLLREAGVDLICGRIRSDAGLEESLSLAEAHKLLLFIDEMGDVLGSMEGSKANSWESRVKPALKDLYSSVDGEYKTAMVISREAVTIIEPHLSIYGTTTHDQFYDSLTGASVKDGFLNRLLVFELPEGRGKKRKINRSVMTPPSVLVDWVKNVHGYLPVDPRVNGDLSNTLGAANHGENVQFPIQAVNYTKGADQLFDEFDEECDERMDGVASYVWSRAAVHAQKLALIRAIGCDYKNPKVVEADAIWAINLTKWSMDRLTRSVIDRVSENRVEGDAKRMLKLIRDAGPNGIQKNDLTRKSHWLKARERDDVIKTLTESGLVDQLKVKGKGRPKVLFRAKMVPDA